MPDAMIWVGTAAVGIVGLAVAAWFLSAKHTRARHASILDELQRRFAGMRMLACRPDACFHGLRRNWDSQWRGRGVLVVTGEFLYFRPWRRKIDLTIPVERIRKVEAVPGEGSRRTAQSLLKISYKGMDDETRIAVWAVSEPHQLVELLGMLQRGS